MAPYPNWGRESSSAAPIAANAVDIATLNASQAVQDPLIAANTAAVASAQADLDVAEAALATAQADIAAINADNATQTELDAAQAAQDAAQALVDAAQDTLAATRQAAQDAIEAELDGIIANTGETVAVGGRVLPLDDPRPYINNTAAAIVLSGNASVDLVADGLTLDVSTADGLRGAPVADNAALTALTAKDYERRKVQSDGKEYVFEAGAVSGTLADDAATGFWQEQTLSFEATKVDAGAGAFTETLAASTNSGTVRLFTNIDVANSATLAVQAGETLNGVANGTFTFSNYTSGTQFRADEVAGGWVVSVVGASSNTGGYNLITALPTDIAGISGSTFVYNSSNPPSGQVAINGASYYDEGAYRHVRVEVVVSDDDDTVYEIGSNIMPVGGEIVSAHISGQSLGSSGRYLVAGVVPGQTNQFFTNRLDAIDNVDMAANVWLKVSNPAGQGSVVLAGMVAPEPSRVLLGTGAGLSNNDVVSISDTWGNLSATYERVEFELITTAGSLNIKQTSTIPTSNWTDDTRTVFYSDAATDTAVIRDMDIAASTANLFLSGGATTVATVNVYGIKPQKTVINTADIVVNDQSASGYEDIGGMRVQWGRATTTSGIVGITLPQPMADTSYSIQLTAANGSNVAMMYTADSVTGFQAVARDPAGGAVDTSLSWHVTGLKP